MVGPVITMDLWTAGGRKQRAPTLDELKVVFDGSDPTPKLLIRGTVSDDGLPMSWTVKTRTHIDHELRRLTVVLELATEALPSMTRVEPFERPFNVVISTDPRPNSVFSDLPYEVRIFSNNARELARTQLRLVRGGEAAPLARGHLG